MDQLEWGIIGCGDVTEVKSGPAFNLVSNSHLAAVMRRDKAKARDYANRHGVPQWYSDAETLLKRQDINAIYVATPPNLHEEYTIAAFNAGKSVYVEKPMALNSAECIRMMEAAEKYSCKLCVAHYRRAQPRFREIRRLINEKTIGDVLSIDLQFGKPPLKGIKSMWRIKPEVSGGGLFNDLAPHQLDLMIYFFGNPLEVEGTSTNKSKLYEADDYVNAEIVFGNDVQFKGIWNFSARPENEIDICEILGTKGNIRFSVFSEMCELTLQGQSTKLQFDHLQHVQQPMIEQVVKYFLDKGPNPCSANEAITGMKIIDRIVGKVN